MTRIRQFAKDMSISYDKAKKLIDKGKKRKDGGSNILEDYMPIVFEGMNKKKKKVPTPKPRPKETGKVKDPFRADKTESLDKEFSKNVAKTNKKNETGKVDLKKYKGAIKKNKGGTNELKKNLQKAVKSKGFKELLKDPSLLKKKPIKKAMGGLKDVPPGNKGKGLSKLPTEVRNKMGFKKKGGTMKMRGGGMAIQGTGFRGVR